MSSIKVLVRVTARDIVHGIKQDCERCAVARAVQRRLKHNFVAQVKSDGSIYIHWRKGYTEGLSGRKYPNDVALYETGPDKRRHDFIARFDKPYAYGPNDQAKPFEFSIDIPETLGWVLAK